MKERRADGAGRFPGHKVRGSLQQAGTSEPQETPRATFSAFNWGRTPGRISGPQGHTSPTANRSFGLCAHAWVHTRNTPGKVCRQAARPGESFVGCTGSPAEGSEQLPLPKARNEPYFEGGGTASPTHSAQRDPFSQRSQRCPTSLKATNNRKPTQSWACVDKHQDEGFPGHHRWRPRHARHTSACSLGWLCLCWPLHLPHRELPGLSVPAAGGQLAGYCGASGESAAGHADSDQERGQSGLEDQSGMAGREGDRIRRWCGPGRLTGMGARLQAVEGAPWE